MKVGIVEVPLPVIEAAMAQMKPEVGGGEFTSADIRDAIRWAWAAFNGVERGRMNDDVVMRAADKLLQRERRAGRIRWDGKHWRLVTP